MPVTTPISLGNRCGTIWNTQPLPMPSAAMAANSRTVPANSGGRVAMPSIGRARDQVESGQHPDAAEPVGEITAQRPQHRAGDHAERREVARLDLREAVLARKKTFRKLASPTNPPKVIA